ncbi:hypothetical protein HN803_05215 [candidate division WWE3 bacterium]|jgi:hypothetical protein|nr:hypothetical protein [candidate division WWE3 bacterium]
MAAKPMTLKRLGIRQVFNWNDQLGIWEAKVKDELSKKVIAENKDVPLAAGTSPVQYYNSFKNTTARVDMTDPSLTVFARAWDDAHYVEDLLKQFWWMKKSEIMKLKATYEEQLNQAGVDSPWKDLSSKPKLTNSQIADFCLFKELEAPNTIIRKLMNRKLKTKADNLKNKRAKKKVKKPKHGRGAGNF